MRKREGKVKRRKVKGKIVGNPVYRKDSFRLTFAFRLFTFAFFNLPYLHTVN
jgi:hypothetical protein